MIIYGFGMEVPKEVNERVFLNLPVNEYTTEFLDDIRIWCSGSPAVNFEYEKGYYA
tara:strand:- start:7991 stop:8158 length:168 start_codon:yes stop_codon:yes gene_type:complete